jgi:hypothetical protein
MLAGGWCETVIRLCTTRVSILGTPFHSFAHLLLEGIFKYNLWYHRSRFGLVFCIIELLVPEAEHLIPELSGQVVPEIRRG